MSRRYGDAVKDLLLTRGRSSVCDLHMCEIWSIKPVYVGCSFLRPSKGAPVGYPPHRLNAARSPQKRTGRSLSGSPVLESCRECRHLDAYSRLEVGHGTLLGDQCDSLDFKPKLSLQPRPKRVPSTTQDDPLLRFHIKGLALAA